MRFKKKKRVKICPNCGSIHIEFKINSHRTGQKFFCKDCGFESSVVLEVDDDLIKKIQKSKRGD